MFKVYIDRVDWSRQIQIFIVDEKEDGRILYLKIENDMPVLHTVTREEIGKRIDPFLILSGKEGDLILQALAEALDQQNIKTDKDAKIQGTLEATKYHLEDLRQLLKLKER